jgi:hypothetical protein
MPTLGLGIGAVFRAPRTGLRDTDDVERFTAVWSARR